MSLIFLFYLFSSAIPVFGQDFPEYMVLRIKIAEQIRKGMTKADVESILGPPDEVREAGKFDRYPLCYAYGVRTPGTFAFAGLVYFSKWGKVKAVSNRFRLSSKSRPQTHLEDIDDILLRAANGLQVVITDAALPDGSLERSSISVQVGIRNNNDCETVLTQCSHELWGMFEVTVYDESGYPLVSQHSGAIISHHIEAGDRYQWIIPGNDEIKVGTGLPTGLLEDPLPPGTYFVRVWFDLYGPDYRVPRFPSNLFEVSIREN